MKKFFNPGNIPTFLTIIILCICIYLLSFLAVPIFIAVVISYLLNPLVTYFDRKQIRFLGRTSIIMIIFLLLITTMVLGIYGVTSTDTVKNFGDTIETMGQPSSEIYKKVNTQVNNFKAALSFDEIQKIDTKEIFVAIKSLLDDFQKYLQELGNVLKDFAVVPILIFFLLKDGGTMKKYLIGLVPNKYFELVLNLIYEVDSSIGGYLRGVILDAAIFGLMATILWGLLGLEYFYILGPFMGLCEIVTYIGPIMGMIPPVIVLLLSDNVTVVQWIGLFASYFIMEAIDETLIYPVIVGGAVQVHPAFIILSIVVAGFWFGLAGILVAIPVMAVVKTLISVLYRELSIYKTD